MMEFEPTTINTAIYREGWNKCKEEMEKTVPFSDLMELADYVRDKTNLAVRISISYRCFDPGNGETCYNLYVSGLHRGLVKFDTVQELKAAMEKIIKPEADQGVSLDATKSEVLLQELFDNIENR